MECITPKLILDVFTLLAAITVAIIYACQLQQMTKATKATERAAQAAQESADLARQQIINSQAAILGIRFDVLYRFMPGEAHGLRSIVAYRSANITGGAAAAKNIHVSLDASWVNVPGLNDIDEPIHVEYDIPAIPQDGNRANVHMVPLKGLNMDIWEEIRQKTKHKTIRIKGSFRYNNGFDPVPDQKFCFVYFAHPEVLGSGSASDFIECERYASTVEMFSAFTKKAAEIKK